MRFGGFHRTEISRLFVVCCLAWGCNDGGVQEGADLGDPDIQLDDTPGLDAEVDEQVADAGDEPDESLQSFLRVAAVQYGAGNYTHVSGCADDLCGLTELVREAATQEAQIVVLPEYALGDVQAVAEWSPEVGDRPAADSRWEAGSIVRTFAELADELDIWVVVNLILQEGAEQETKLYNALLALDANGAVAARHYKFQLFAEEGEHLTEGDSVASSFIDTPAGRAGLLICADAQCIVTGMSVTGDCTSHAIRTLRSYFENHPAVVLFSAKWTVGSSNTTWGAIPVQQQIATYGGVWVVAANTTLGDGIGGGIVQPDGEYLDLVESRSPSIVYGNIPIEP